MCYTYPTAETEEIAGEHILTGLETGTDQTDDMWWLNTGTKYVMFELDGQTYQMVGGGKSWLDEKYGLEALWKVDNGARPDTIFEPIKVNVTATPKSLEVTRVDTGDLIFRAAEDRPRSFSVEARPEVAQFRVPPEETLGPPSAKRTKELVGATQ